MNHLSNIKENDQVFFQGILGGDLRVGIFKRFISPTLAEVDYNDKIEQNHVNNLAIAECLFCGDSEVETNGYCYSCNETAEEFGFDDMEEAMS